MPETLNQKRKQIYDHFLKVIAKPKEYPILYQTLANNTHGYYMEGARLKTQIAELEQRLVCLEAKINRLAQMADLRMTLTEQRQDLLCKVLVKLTKQHKA